MPKRLFIEESVMRGFGRGFVVNLEELAVPLVARSAAYINSRFLRCPILEFLWVHEADRDSGSVEDAHHLARHVVYDDWALCAAAA